MRGPNNVQMQAQAAIEAWTKHADAAYQSELKNYVESPNNELPHHFNDKILLVRSGSELRQEEPNRDTNTELAVIDSGEGNVPEVNAIQTPQTALALSGATEELIRSNETGPINPNEGIKSRETEIQRPDDVYSFKDN